MNGLGTNYEMGREALSASITIIPKEGKDSTLCSSYRPISLLNADTKLFAKVVATRMKNLMTDLVHADQVGFIPSREGGDNRVRKSERKIHQAYSCRLMQKKGRLGIHDEHLGSHGDSPMD